LGQGCARRLATPLAMNGSSGGTSSGKAIAPPSNAVNAQHAKASLVKIADILARLEVAIDSGTLPMSSVNCKDKLHFGWAKLVKGDLELLLRLHKDADKKTQAITLDAFRALPYIIEAFNDQGKNRMPPNSSTVSTIKKKVKTWERERLREVEAVANEARDAGAPQALPAPRHCRPRYHHPSCPPRSEPVGAEGERAV